MDKKTEITPTGNLEVNEMKQFFKKLTFNIIYIVIVLYIGKAAADYVSIRQFKKETTEAIRKSVKSDEFLNYWTLQDMKRTLESKQTMDEQDKYLYRMVIEELNLLKTDLKTRGGDSGNPDNKTRK